MLAKLTLFCTCKTTQSVHLFWDVNTDTQDLATMLPPVLLKGAWVDIGHDSAIILKKGSILHRSGGVVRKHDLAWLVLDKPLLNWVLKN